MLLQFFNYDNQWLAYVGSILAAFLSSFITILLIKKNKDKQLSALNYLIFSVFFLSVSAHTDWILVTIKGQYPSFLTTFDYIGLGSYISFSGNALSNILIILFMQVIFHENKSSISRILILILQVSVIPGFMIVFVLKHFGSNIEILEYVFLFLHILCSLTIYISLLKNSLNLRKHVNLKEKANIIAYKGLTYYAITGVLFSLAIFFFITHEVFLSIPIREYWTVCFGWVLGSIAAVYIYLGYVNPNWLKKRWLSKSIIMSGEKKVETD